MQAKKLYLNQLADQFLAIENRTEMIDFFEGIFTPQELSDLPVRLQIVKALKAGRDQRSIAKELGVGIATITRGSKEIKRGKFKQVI